MPKAIFRSFPELCADHGLFQPAPPKGYERVGLDEVIRPGALVVAVYAHSQPRITGYDGKTPRTIFRWDSEYCMRVDVRDFCFFNPKRL